MLNRPFQAVSVMLLAGCAVESPSFDHAWLTPEVERRTGHKLRPEAAGDESELPPGVLVEDGVTEEEAVAIALWNNKEFHATLATLGLARADLVKAGLLQNPVLSVLFPLGPKQLEFALSFPLEALFLRSKRVAVAEVECQRVGAQLVQHGLDLVRDVRVAIADLARLRTTLGLRTSATGVRAARAAFFASRLRAGDVSELATDDARIAVLEAESEAARSRRDVDRAERRLRELLGLALSGLELRFVTTAVPPPDAPRAPHPDITDDVDVLVRQALANRPDLRAAELEVEVAGRRAGLADLDWLKLAFVIDAKGYGPGGDDANMGPGLDLELPVFHRGDGAKARASAELLAASRSFVATRHRIAGEVADAALREQTSRGTLLRLQREVLPAIEAARRRSQRAHDGGATTIEPVLARDERLVDARLREAQAVAEHRRDLAQLERSIGGRLTARGARK